MAQTINPTLITNITEYPNSFKRQGAFPLERYSVFTALEGEGGAKDYAANNPISYVGQHIVVVENNIVAAYVIASEAGDLVRLAATAVDADETLEDAVTRLESRVGSLESKVATLESKAASLESADTALGKRIDDVESDISDQAAAIAANTGSITSITGRLDTAESTLASKIDSISGGNGVEIGGTATSPIVQLKIDTIEGNALQNTEDGLKVIVPAAIDYSLTIDSSETAEGDAKTYKFNQNGTTIGTINVPKDMVVSSGLLVTDPEGQEPGKYIELTLANATADKLYINVSDLIDDKPVEGATTANIAVTVSDVDGKYQVSAALVEGSVQTAHIADEAVSTAKIAGSAVTTAKIADNAVTLTKLDTSVQSSLGLADSALQAADVDLASGDTNGTVKITVDGNSKDVAVTGLGGAAYKSVAASVSSSDTGLVSSDIVAAYVAEATAVRRYE